MKIKHPFILGLLVVMVPFAGGSGNDEEQPPDVPVKKVAAPQKRPLNPYFTELLKEYEQEIIKLKDESRTTRCCYCSSIRFNHVYIKGIRIEERVQT
jgi:hypothetical protein